MTSKTRLLDQIIVSQVYYLSEIHFFEYFFFNFMIFNILQVHDLLYAAEDRHDGQLLSERVSLRRRALRANGDQRDAESRPRNPRHRGGEGEFVLLVTLLFVDRVLNAET